MARLNPSVEGIAGAVWLYTEDGELARYQNGKVNVCNVPAEPFNKCRAVIAEKSGLVWIGTDPRPNGD